MKFKVGDRVRRTVASSVLGYKVGDEATVIAVLPKDVLVDTKGTGRHWALEYIEVVQPVTTTTNEPGYTIKDSGTRQEFTSGMVRDTTTGKTQYHRVLEGPMFARWAEHLTKGAVKYPDRENGQANWTLASGEPEARRFKESALRHFIQWYMGATDEDHGSAIIFNVNGYEYVKEKLSK